MIYRCDTVSVQLTTRAQPTIVPEDGVQRSELSAASWSRFLSAPSKSDPYVLIGLFPWRRGYTGASFSTTINIYIYYIYYFTKAPLILCRGSTRLYRGTTILHRGTTAINSILYRGTTSLRSGTTSHCCPVAASSPDGRSVRTGKGVLGITLCAQTVRVFASRRWCLPRVKRLAVGMVKRQLCPRMKRWP